MKLTPIKHLAVLANVLNFIFYEGNKNARRFTIDELAHFAQVTPCELMETPEIINGIKRWQDLCMVKIDETITGINVTVIQPNFPELRP